MSPLADLLIAFVLASIGALIFVGEIDLFVHRVKRHRILTTLDQIDRHHREDVQFHPLLIGMADVLGVRQTEFRYDEETQFVYVYLTLSAWTGFVPGYRSSVKKRARILLIAGFHKLLQEGKQLPKIIGDLTY